MKFDYRILLGFLAVLGLVFTCSNIPQIIKGKIATIQTPPEGFDPTQYPRIFDTSGTDQIRVVDTTSFGDKWTGGHHLPQKQLFILTFYSEEKPSVVAFYNHQGEQVGIYEHPVGGSYYELRNNEILTPDGYYTVTGDGLGPLQPYPVIETAPINEARVEALKKQSTQTHVVKYYEAPDDSNEALQKLDTLLFKVGDVWQKALISSETFIGVVHDFPETLIEDYDIYEEGAPAQPNEPIFNPQFNIVRDWFERGAFSAKTSAPIGSPTGQGTPAYWRGIGYYTATIDGQAFRFSLQGEKQLRDFDNRTKAGYLWAPGMEFIQLQTGPGSYTFPYLLVPID